MARSEFGLCAWSIETDSTNQTTHYEIRRQFAGVGHWYLSRVS
jgi:hypothetical protein